MKEFYEKLNNFDKRLMNRETRFIASGETTSNVYDKDFVKNANNKREYLLQLVNKYIQNNGDFFIQLDKYGDIQVFNIYIQEDCKIETTLEETITKKKKKKKTEE